MEIYVRAENKKKNIPKTTWYWVMDKNGDELEIARYQIKNNREIKKFIKQ